MVILLAGFLFRLVIAIFLHPGYDEAYYYLYTLHPDWSYFDHPPLVSLTTGFGVWLTGSVSQFTIRIGSLLLYTGSLTFLYLAALRLYTLQIAIVTLAIASTIPIFQVAFGSLTSPDSPLIFFWSLSLWLAAQEFFEYQSYRPSFRLSLLCLTVGLACLSKYHGFILCLSLIGFCLFSPTYRAALKSQWFFIGLLLFLLTISPVLIWNSQHEWVSFLFQSQRAVPNQGYHLDRVILSLLVELVYLFPVFGIPLLWTVISGTWKSVTAFRWQVSNKGSIPRTEWDREKRNLLLCLSAPLIFGFTLISGYQQILPAWKMPAYYSAVILLAERVVIATRYSRYNPQYRWFFDSIVTIIVILFIALSHISLGTFQTPSKSMIAGLLPIAIDNSTQLIDIQQLRQGFINNPKLNLALKKADFVFTNRYYSGGQIAMAIEQAYHKPIECFDEDPRGFAFWSKANQWIGKNGLFIATTEYKAEQDAKNRYPKYFTKITKLGNIPIVRGGEVVQNFGVYQAIKMIKPFARPYGNR